MKNGRFILPEKLQGKQGRTLLAVGIGLLAMVLILLSELLPQSTKPGPADNGCCGRKTGHGSVSDAAGAAAGNARLPDERRRQNNGDGHIGNG